MKKTDARCIEGFCYSDILSLLFPYIDIDIFIVTAIPLKILNKKNGQKLSKMVKMVKMVQNDLKWFQMVQNHPKW